MFVITPHTGEVSAVALSPDGRLLASVSTDRWVKVWDTARLESAPPRWERLGHPREINHAQFTPDGTELLTCGTEGSLRAWRATDGEPLRESRPDPGRTLFGSINAFVFSPDGEQVAWGGNGTFGAVDILVARTAELVPLRRLAGHRGPIAIIAAFDGGWVSGGVDRTIRFWDGATGACVRSIRAFDIVRGLSVNREGTLLAGCAGRDVTIWELPQHGEGYTLPPTGERQLRGHTEQVESLEFADGGRLLASTGFDGTIRVWDTASGEVLRTFDPGLGRLHWVTFAPDGLTLAFSSQSGHVGLLDVDV